MGKRQPLDAGEKAYLWRRKQAGASHRQVAQELGCSLETVRKWWRIARRGGVPRPRGRPASGILSRFPTEIGQTALELKQAHPHWGPANVLLELRKTFPGPEEPLPSSSRLSVWFKARCPQAVQRRSPPRAPAAPPPVTRQIHQRWQIDAKEAVRLQDGEIASALDVRDPVSAVMIASQAFLTTLTPTTYRKLTLAEIQATLRPAFADWGRPAQIQTDHEDVYAGAHQSDFPMPFTLWLIGLGIQHCFSRDRHPTDQPQIERNHRTLADLGWKDRPPKDLSDFQQQLDAARQRYNGEFPAHAADCQGQPPLVCHPQALHSGRPYRCEGEWDLFDLTAVDRYLAQFSWMRRTDSQGVAFVANHPYRLGREHQHLAVVVRFLPEQRAFSFANEQGEVLKILPAIGLEQSDLTGLSAPPLSSGSSGIPLQLSLPWVGV